MMTLNGKAEGHTPTRRLQLLLRVKAEVEREYNAGLIEKGQPGVVGINQEGSR